MVARMSGKRVCASAIVLLGLTAMPAQARDGFYLSLEGGAGIVDDWEQMRTEWLYSIFCAQPTKREAVATFETGWAGFGAFGFAFHRWRFEVEGGYRSNDIASYEKESIVYRLLKGPHD